MQWAIDPTHSQITFSVKHLGISTVRGSFEEISGTIDERDGAVAGADIVIDVARPSPPVAASVTITSSQPIFSMWPTIPRPRFA